MLNTHEYSILGWRAWCYKVLFSTYFCVLFLSLFVLVQRPFGTHSIWSGLVKFSRTAHPNELTLNTALPRVPSNSPAKFEVDCMNGCHGRWQTYCTYIHTHTHMDTHWALWQGLSRTPTWPLYQASNWALCKKHFNSILFKVVTHQCNTTGLYSTSKTFSVHGKSGMTILEGKSTHCCVLIFIN